MRLNWYVIDTEVESSAEWWVVNMKESFAFAGKSYT